MKDMNKLLDKVKFDQEQSSSWSSNNVVEIPRDKKNRQNRQRNPNNADLHILPLQQIHRQAPESDVSRPIHLRVLLVEDNAADRQACRQALQHSSDLRVDLVEVANGEDGLCLYSQQKFDCILLDYNLPDMSGMAFLGRLADLMAGQGLPILKLITPEKPQLFEEILNGAVQDYLIKDQDGHYLKLLPTLIQRMLERHSLSHEKHQIETMYRALVEHIPAITYIVSPRNGNRLLYVSPQIEQLGYLSEDRKSVV